MSDEDADARLGHSAAVALDVLDIAFAEFRAAAVEEMIKSAPEALAKRERLIVACQILPAVRAAIEKMVANGTAAEIALRDAELTRR